MTDARPTGVPDGIEDRHTRDVRPRAGSTLPLLLLGSLLLAALFGVFGGTGPETLNARAAGGEVEVRMPTTLRSGVFFEMAIDIRAGRDLVDVVLGVEPALWRHMTINTTKPEASEEQFEDGMIRLHYGPLDAGEEMELKIDGQVNPDLYGGTEGNISLFDDDERILTMPATLTVLP